MTHDNTIDPCTLSCSKDRPEIPRILKILKHQK